MKSYIQYLTKEDHLHIAVCKYIVYQYPKVLFHHSPNEGRRSKYEQYKIKKLYVKAGFPDIFIAQAAGRYHGLFIELKVKPNKCTPKQKQWVQLLNQKGYKAVVCYGFDEVKDIVDSYLGTIE